MKQSSHHTKYKQSQYPKYASNCSNPISSGQNATDSYAYSQAYSWEQYPATVGGGERIKAHPKQMQQSWKYGQPSHQQYLGEYDQSHYYNYEPPDHGGPDDYSTPKKTSYRMAKATKNALRKSAGHDINYCEYDVSNQYHDCLDYGYEQIDTSYNKHSGRSSYPSN